MSAEAVKVAVRVRPFNGREKEANSRCIVRMKGPVTTLINPETEEEKEFAFDYSYWSHDGMDTLDEPEPDLGYPGGGCARSRRRAARRRSQRARSSI